MMRHVTAFRLKANNVTTALAVALSAWFLFTASLYVWVERASSLGDGRSSPYGYVVSRAQQWRRQKRNVRASYSGPQTDKPLPFKGQRVVGDRSLVHLHIGKSGGSSLDRIGFKLAQDSGRRYVGYRHFDWSYIDKISNVTNVDVVMFLRHPVARAESHFDFAKGDDWTRKLRMFNQTIEECLHDPESLLQCRDVWQDQQASIMWLTGNHIASWAGAPPEEKEEREQRGLDYVRMCHLAAKRLNETFWFGILEDLERSMELLQHALKLDYRPQLPKSNVGMKNPKAPPLSEWSRKALESLMPQDIWLYNYAKTLFEARWVEYKTGVFTEPELPPLPDLPCRSTRFELNCTSGPLAESGPLYFHLVT